MPQNKNNGNKPHYNNKNYHKNNYQNGNKRVVETNATTTSSVISNEQNGYSILSAQDMSNKLFGLNIFDYYSVEELTAMVRDPIANNEMLRKLSWMIYSSDGMTTNVVDYSVSLLSLNYVLIPHGKNENKKIANKSLFNSALKSIKHKQLCRDSIMKDALDGVSFYYAMITDKQSNAKYLSDFDVMNIVELNDIGKNISLLPLPVDYTKIVARRNSIYQLAFDVKYFEQYNSEEERNRRLRTYPDEIVKAWNEYSNNGNKNWVVLDYQRTVVTKVRSKIEETWGRPIVLSALKDILYFDYYTDTKRNTLDEINNRIIYQTFPEGEKKGVCALNKTQQENQHNVVKQAIMNKNARNKTSFFSLACGTKLEKMETDTSIFTNKEEQENLITQIGLDYGFMSNLLTGTGSGNFSAQANNLDLLMSQMMTWIEPFAEELTKVINHLIIKDPKHKVELCYLPCSIINREKFVDNMKELYTLGCGSLTAWIASTGIDTESYFTLMDLEKAENFDEKYKPHQTSFTMSKSGNEQSEKGRPVKEDSVIPSTLSTRDNNGNNAPKPSMK